MDGLSNLLAARSQMAFTLGFHILLVPFGVCLPLFALIANGYGLRHGDEAALRLARRWSHAMGVTFAVGAVTGTVLSFEMGLLWPGLMGRFGDVFGLPFMIEGVAFFLEAIFIAIYIFGWDRLSPRTHFRLGLPLPLFAFVGALSIIAANSWMNTPRGFRLDAAGKPIDVVPLQVIFNPALRHELVHFLLAALLCAGFVVAAIYAVGMLKGRRDRLHRLGFLIPFTVAAVAMPLQMVVGRPRGPRGGEAAAGEVRRDRAAGGDGHPRPGAARRAHEGRRPDRRHQGAGPGVAADRVSRRHADRRPEHRPAALTGRPRPSSTWRST